MTIAELLSEARRALAAAPFAPATREATLLLGHVLELDEARILAHSRDSVASTAEARFRALLKRRLSGEPVAYLTGEREFYGRPFQVDRRVLIPRPETEHLIETVLGLHLPAHPLILDLGTGSGAIGITLALELPRSEILATDLSLGALAIASLNRKRHRLEARVRLIQGNLADPVSLSRVDLVVSNPPYIDFEERPELSPEVRDFEPGLALYASRRGLSVIEDLLDAAALLRPGVPLLLEIGAGQSEEIRRRLPGAPLALEEVKRDYAGIDRIVVLRRR
ncbi:MAG TPA: peptide chain release factor N(5)-glutamine methyltransferase [Thermoanaerobaculia bacterium]|nr:peptide chain release factor N(5)-glutamine methyltransferase [Thermoanaerobaculia bacterium]